MISRYFLLSFFALLLSVPNQAQNISADWGYDLFREQLPNGVLIDTSYGAWAYASSGDSLFLQTFAETRDVATDQLGNSISVSEYQGSYYEFPAINIVPLLPNGIILDKRDASGNLLWSRYMKGGSTPIGWSITTDSHNNILVCGDYGDTLDVDPDPNTVTLLQGGAGLNKNGFVAKIDPNGNLITGLNFVSTDEFTCYDIALDAQDNMYVVGEFEGTADFDPGAGVANETATGSAENLFVVKLDAQGNYLWHHVSQTSDFSRAYKCAVDDQSSVYVVGEFSDQVDFSGTGSNNQNSQGSFDAFVFKLDSAGNYGWARTYGTTSLEYIRAVHHDGQDLVLAGYFQGTLNVDPGVSNFSVSTTQGFSAYVQKLDNQGNHLWADEVGDGIIQIRDIKSNSLGSNLLVGSLASAGTFNVSGCSVSFSSQDQDILALMLDSTNQTIWVEVWNSTEADWANGVSIVNDQEWVIGGTFQDELYLNPPIDILVYGEGSGYEGLTFRMSKCTVDSLIIAAACNSYTSPSGRYTWTTAGTYHDTLFSAAGCDSLFTIDLTLEESPLTSIQASACDEYVSPLGNVYTVSGIYLDTLTNVAACDSVVEIDLTITATPDTGVVQIGDSLMAVDTAATYQWLSCDSVLQPIAGATDHYFIASETGAYALQITRNGCVDTSACYAIMVTGIDEQQVAPIAVYPNPVVGTSVFLELPVQHSYQVVLTDAFGRLHWAGTIQGGQQLEVPPTPGFYFLQLQSEGGPRQTVKLIRAQ